jgi:hypothetical protein
MDWRPVALAMAVALAGCGAIVGGGPGPDSRTASQTLTPAPIPAVTATPVPLPPGVTGDGVRDPEALFGAHQSFLEGKSYTLRTRVRIGETSVRRLIRQETPDRYYTHDSQPGPRGNVTQFAANGSTYVRSAFAGVVRYDRLDAVQRPNSQTVEQSVAFFRPERVRVARATVDGRPAFEITGVNLDYPDAPGVRNYTLRAVVEPSGFIRSLDVSYVRTEDGRSVEHSFAYADVEATTVDRPDWVDREFDDTGA